jgi:hypothetical protein
MIINNALDLYDLYIPYLLKQKLSSVVDAKFIYCPSDLCFSYAAEKFGETIFPLYSVFRNDPIQISEQGSLANYRKSYLLSASESINFLNISLDYQIDFFSNDAMVMNLMNIDYWKKLRRDPNLVFNFKEIGIEDVKFQTTLLFPSDIQSNNNITDMFKIGRFFRYTFGVRINALMFDINAEVEAEKFIFSIYETRDVNTLIHEKEIIL